LTQTEIIDRLCDVTCRQSSVIRELSHLITQSETFDSETKDELSQKINALDTEIDIIEYRSGNLRHTISRYSNNS